VPRPSKLTTWVADQIALAVKGAASFKAAAELAGVAERSLHAWRARGRAERERLESAALALEALPKRARTAQARKARMAAQRAAQPLPDELRYLELDELLEHADAEAQGGAAAQLAAAGANEWRAAAWLLERRDPEHFGPPRARVAVSGVEDGPIALNVSGFDLSVLSDDELQVLQKLCERSDGEARGC
jgi:hypothetical protein